MKTRNAFLIIALLLTGCVTPNPGPDGIPAFRWIDREWGICAGGQPTVSGWYWLSTQSAGSSGQFPGKISRVIKLNTEEEGSDSVAELQLGMTVIRVPIDTRMQLDPGEANMLASLMRQGLHMVQPGTFIHCERGQDRTGAFVYAYRRDHGWTDAQARAELDAFGFHHVLMGLDKFVRDYAPVPAAPYLKRLASPKEKP